MVTVKYAMTLDGSVAASDGSSRWISGEKSRADAHLARATADAVIVGAGTLRADNPSLDVRTIGYDGPQPVPVIVAGSRPLPADSVIWERNPIVLSTVDRPLVSGELIEVEGAEGIVDPTLACRKLAEKGLLDLLVEGGPTLVRAWWNAGVIHRGIIYLGSRFGVGTGIAPIAGSFATMSDAIDVTVTGVDTLGSDIRVDFEVK